MTKAYRTFHCDEEFAWVKARIVRSNHDMWTLQVLVVDRDHEVLAEEHLLIGPAQIDIFTQAGVPVKNPIPLQPPLKGKR